MLATAILVLLAFGCVEPPSLTPDVAVLRIAPTQCGAEQSPKRIKDYIDSEVEKEIRRIRDADLIVLGTVARATPELHEQGIRTVITMSVERCLRGSCDDSTRFYVSGGRFGDHTHKLHPALAFRPGDRALVLLRVSDEQSTGHDLPELHPEQRYSLDHDGLVVRKRIPIEQFITELEELLARVT
jgi:hypothetical protein